MNLVDVSTVQYTNIILVSMKKIYLRDATVSDDKSSSSISADRFICANDAYCKIKSVYKIYNGV